MNIISNTPLFCLDTVSAYTSTYGFAALITAWLQRSDELMISFGKKKILFHTLFSSVLKGTLNAVIDTQTFQLVCIQLVYLEEQILK